MTKIKKTQNLKPKLRIAVIHGGVPVEGHSVMRKTANPRGNKTYQVVAQDIVHALKSSGLEYVIALPEDMNLPKALIEHNINFCWLNTGGTQGICSMSHAASMLEMLGIPYVGHNPRNSAILDSKDYFKSFLLGQNIPTSSWLVCNPDKKMNKADFQAQLDRAFFNWTGEYIVKPTSGRASLHVKHVATQAELAAAVEDIYVKTNYKVNVLVEKYLSGSEYAMAVMGPMVSRRKKLEINPEPFIFSGVERVLNGEPIFTSMDVKAISDDRMRVLCPNNDAHAWDQMAVICQQVYESMSLETAIRIDFRADDKGIIHVLEANPKPDLKRPDGNVTSLICAGLEAESMEYNCLIESMLWNRVSDLLDAHPDFLSEKTINA